MTLSRTPSVVLKKKLTESAIDELHQELETIDHVIPLHRLCQKLFTDPVNGMNPATAERILFRDGLNALSPAAVTPECIKFLKCMYGGFALLLWICALLCFILYGISMIVEDSAKGDGIEYFGCIIVLICLISGIFAYHQESKNTKVMESFKKMVPTFATVIRNGTRMEIPTEELVTGDLVEIRLGDKIPADVRIIESVGLQVENSSITGESEPQTRTSHPTDDNPLESRNVAFFSSYAVAGEGKAIVIATGDNTMIGRLAGLTTHLTKTETPLAKEIKHFVHIITSVALVSGIFFFCLSLTIEKNVIKAFSYLLGIIIANIPEVLLVSVTTSLTLTAQKMANKNCLVKNLEAVETLGSTSIICSDKTGTLTQNKMTVSNIWYANTRQHFAASEKLGKEKDLLLESDSFRTFLKCATLCLRAEFKTENESFVPVEKREVMGDASETGILKFCELVHATKSFRETYPKVAEKPFDSTSKHQISIHREEGKGYTMVMKGAPEVIIEFCNFMLDDHGRTVVMTIKDITAIKKTCMELGYLGERVIAYADNFLPSEDYGPDYKFNIEKPEVYNFPKKNYRFIGLVGLTDPPRPFVAEAVYKCRTAGIKVIMVTGDHPVTATAIAKKVGIINENYETNHEKFMDRRQSISYEAEEDSLSIVVTGAEIRNMELNELDELIKNHEEIVFARTSPQQKLLIVESCQRLGEIVAVTGDGVNDSPALRKADIGVAMGIAGSDVTKHAADMILMDDNFASIVTGIEEGRLIFDNLKKSIAYTLTSSVPEMLPILSSIIFSIPLPIVIEMILCIDIGTDLLPAIALVYEKAESDIMKRAPRNPNYDKLVNKRLISVTYGQIGMTQAMAGFCTYFCILLYHGFLPKDLFGLRIPWEDPAVINLKDSWGNDWDYKSRMRLLNHARTGYFISIVITQMIDLIMCKTRMNSIFRQGMDNWVLNLAIVFELVLTGLLLYVPGTENVLKTMPIDTFWFWPCLPYGIALWIYDEMRRLAIRKQPTGFFARETYY